MSDKEYKFLDQFHTAASIEAMSQEDLLSLRNLVATNLGVATVRGFKDHPNAVEQTIKALQRYEEVTAAEAAQAGAPATAGIKAAKAPKTPKEPAAPRGPAKSSGPKHVKRPTPKMFATIKKIKEHTGAEGRAHRWPNYKDGMTIVDVIEGDGTEPWDVYNWEKQGLMSVTMPTDAEYTALKAAWYKRHNLVDPDLAKENKVAEKAAAKKKRDEEAAAKKVAADEAKAKKAAEDKAAAEAAAAAAPAAS